MASAQPTFVNCPACHEVIVLQTQAAIDRTETPIQMTVIIDTKPIRDHVAEHEAGE